MRVALFVEGSSGALDRNRRDVFTELWISTMVRVLGLRSIELVIPINKKHLVALDPRNPPMSGAGEPLDELLIRHLKRQAFDVAVIAWDLQPMWAVADEAACRWRETCNLYQFLFERRRLPEPWAAFVGDKYRELISRPLPSARTSLPELISGGIYALCMDPVFEAFLIFSEVSVKKALDVTNIKMNNWPSRWNLAGVSRPEIEILQKAIAAAQSVRPKRKAAHVVHGDMWTSKHAWAKYLIERFSIDDGSAQSFRSTAVAHRLLELLPLPVSSAGPQRVARQGRHP